MTKINRNSILKKLRAEKEYLKQEFNIKEIGLFGSFSINKQNKKSDIDFIFDVEDDSNFDFAKLIALEDYLKKLLDFKKVELVNKKFMNPIVKSSSENNVIYV